VVAQVGHGAASAEVAGGLGDVGAVGRLVDEGGGSCSFVGDEAVASSAVASATTDQIAACAVRAAVTVVSVGSGGNQCWRRVGRS
jgi:hypothetical protein